ncbi:hypothetical protein [Streptomyces sp. YIM 132580]|uniref:hypothetical protein n=1 Tax=Streptomyces sp. YIM 132580 TaxID=2691958 RepID=UPI001368019E|nr:hypothetical protein [Streptomyces sp. YIM 132580]MXG30495.1 hypothetical protein [Streptomyces sp. YIM 132580]
MTTTMTNAPAPTTAPAPVPVAASRRSVHLLMAAVGCLAVACLLYVLVDRPGLRGPLADLATIITPLVGAAGLFRGASRASQ